MKNRRNLFGDMFVWLVIFVVLAQSAAIDFIYWLRERPWMTGFLTIGGYVVTMALILNSLN